MMFKKGRQESLKVLELITVDKETLNFAYDNNVNILYFLFYIFFSEKIL